MFVCEALGGAGNLAPRLRRGLAPQRVSAGRPAPAPPSGAASMPAGLTPKGGGPRASALLRGRAGSAVMPRMFESSLSREQPVSRPPLGHHAAA